MVERLAPTGTGKRDSPRQGNNDRAGTGSRAFALNPPQICRRGLYVSSKKGCRDDGISRQEQRIARASLRSFHGTKAFIVAVPFDLSLNWSCWSLSRGSIRASLGIHCGVNTTRRFLFRSVVLLPLWEAILIRPQVT